MKEYTFFIKKTLASSTMKDSNRDFGIVVLDVNLPDIEMKELVSQEWAEEDGDDVFIGTSSFCKSQKMSVNLGLKCNVSEWESKFDEFVCYLSGFDNTGVESLVWFPFHKTGRKCRMNNVRNLKPCITGKEIIIEFEVELIIDNPRIRVSPNIDIKGDVTDLTEAIR